MTDFTRGQSVMLDLEHHGRWSAQVEAVMPDRVAVAALAQLPVGGAELAGTGVHLATACERGVLRVPGIIVAADRAGLVEVVLTGDAVVDQRRHWVRIAASLPGLVAPRSEEHPPLHTFTLDVSGGGVLVAGAGPVEIGTPVALTVKLPDRDPLRTGARIARRTHGGHVGVMFEGIDEAERELLVRWIFERQRLERKAARERH